MNAAEKQTILAVTPPDGVTIDDLTTTWTLAEGDLEAGQTLREVAKTRVELQGADLASGQRYHDLVLSLGAMVPGGTYKFLLTATLTSETGDTTEGYASVSVSASALPSAGVVVASPRKGSELETPFELVASYGSATSCRSSTATRRMTRSSDPDGRPEARGRAPLGARGDERRGGGRGGRLLRRARRRRLSDEEEAARGNVTLRVVVVDQPAPRARARRRRGRERPGGRGAANLTNELDNAPLPRTCRPCARRYARRPPSRSLATTAAACRADDEPSLLGGIVGRSPWLRRSS